MERTNGEDRPGDPGSDTAPPPELPAEAASSSSAEAATLDQPAVDWQSPAPDAAALEAAALEAGWRGIGSVVGRTFDTYGSAFGLFLVLSAPVAIFSATSVFADRNPLAFLLVALFTVAAAIVTGAAMMLATDDLWRGVRPTIGDVLDRAAGRAVALFLLAALAILAVAGLAVVMLGAAALLGIAGAAGSVRGPGLVVVVIFAVLIAIVVTIISLRWGVSAQAIVLDGLRPVAGLRRSWSVTRRHTWRLAGLSIALGLLGALASTGASLLSGYASERALAAIGLALATLVTSPLIVIATSIVYRDLGGRSEGAGEGLPRRAGRVTSSIAVFGGGLIVCAAGIWSVVGAGGQIFIPDRGQVIAGTSSNVVDRCRPGGVKTTFTSAEEIWIAAVFSRRVPAGDEVIVEFFVDGERLGSAPLTAPSTGFDCYYELNPVVGGAPGTYRITVRYGASVIADGTFTIQ